MFSIYSKLLSFILIWLDHLLAVMNINGLSVFKSRFNMTEILLE